MVSERRAGTHALAEVLPLQMVFSAACFVSVGMLLGLGLVLGDLPLVLGAAAACRSCAHGCSTRLRRLRSPERSSTANNAEDG